MRPGRSAEHRVPETHPIGCPRLNNLIHGKGRIGMNRRLFLLLAVMLIVSAVFAGVTVASPPSGVTPHVLAWGTYDAFHKVKTDPHSPIDFEAKAKTPVDVIVREHDYA